MMTNYDSNMIAHGRIMFTGKPLNIDESLFLLWHSRKNCSLKIIGGDEYSWEFEGKVSDIQKFHKFITTNKR